MGAEEETLTTLHIRQEAADKKKHLIRPTLRRLESPA
jgi:hypothetical protein